MQSIFRFTLSEQIAIGSLLLEALESLCKRRRREDVLALDNDVAPTPGPRHSVVKQPALVLDIAADLIRPYDHDAVELTVLGLLHSHRGEEMRCTTAMLPPQRHVASNHRLDLHSGKLRPSDSMDLVFHPQDCGLPPEK